MWIAEEAQFTELTSQRIIGHQATDERLTGVEQELDGLDGLQEANHAGEYTQYTGFGTTGSQGHGRWLWIETAIARPFIGFEDG